VLSECEQAMPAMSADVLDQSREAINYLLIEIV
jgi:hypothetical protein